MTPPSIKLFFMLFLQITYYVRDFFQNLHETHKDNKTLVKNITDNCDIFCKKMTNKIEEVCDRFFGFTQQNYDEW